MANLRKSTAAALAGLGALALLGTSASAAGTPQSGNRGFSSPTWARAPATARA